MIDAVLVLLRDLMNEHLRSMDPSSTPGSDEADMMLVEGDKLDPLTLKVGAVSLLLVNVETETATRQADPFRRTLTDGSTIAVTPEIHLNLYVLFVSRYRVYEQSLAKLSSVIDYFQSRPVLDHSTEPAMSPDLAKLHIELVTLRFAEQTEMWSGLRAAYQPSVLYRIRVVRVTDEVRPQPPEIREVVTVVNQ